MFNKQLLVSALVVTFCFGFIGTAMAGSVAYDESQIEKFVQAEAAKSDKGYKSGNIEQAHQYIPAGVISNLDATTSKLDSMLYAEDVSESTTGKYVGCYVPAGVISNLDTTTAKLDAKLGC